MNTRHRVQRRAGARGSESRQLSESDILNAALLLIRRAGSQTLSMRTLATELGVTPMAIYHYVPNKAALVQKLGDLVLGDISMPTPTGTHWSDEFKQYALEEWQRVALHPGLTDLLLEQPPTRVQRRRMRYAASILVAAGFDQRRTRLAITSYYMFMFGLVSTQARISRAGTKPPRADRFREYLGTLDFRELVEYEIDIIIAGLRASTRNEDRPRRMAKRPADRASRSS